MSAAQLLEWAKRNLVPAAEGEPLATKQVQLSTENQTWDTWTVPVPDLDQWVQQANALVTTLTAEMPVRYINFVFTALTAEGTTRSTHQIRVMGTNKAAGELSQSANAQASKAFAEAMTLITNVVSSTLKSAQIQLDSLTKTLESQAEQLHDLHEYNRALKEQEVLAETKTAGDPMAAISEQIRQAGPVLMSALEMMLEERKTSLAKLASGAAQAVNTTTNGAV
jgi:hypothetical protein